MAKTNAARNEQRVMTAASGSDNPPQRPIRKRILAQRHLAKLACFNLGGEFLSEANDYLVSAGAKMKHDGNQLQEPFSIPRLNSE